MEPDSHERGFNHRDEEDLVARAQRGDFDAYNVLLRHYRDLALGTAFMILGDRQDAEDAVQEAFTRAFRALPRFRPDGAFRAWLMRIVVNQARTVRATTRREADVLSRASGQLPRMTPPPSAEAAALAQGRREALLRSVLELPERDRLIITYRYFFDMSEEDTAAALGIARGTVKSRLARALVRLRPIVEDLGPLAIAGPGLLGVLTLLRRNPAGGAAAAGIAVVALAAGLTVLPDTARMDRSPSVASAPTPAAVVMAPPRRMAVVYGGDLTVAERSELSKVFGAPADAAVETLSRAELEQGLSARGEPATPEDEALSSVAMECTAGGSGVHVRTVNIGGLSPTDYEASLRAAGVQDANVTVAAPADRWVSGETALIGALRAARICTEIP